MVMWCQGVCSMIFAEPLFQAWKHKDSESPLSHYFFIIFPPDFSLPPLLSSFSYLTDLILHRINSPNSFTPPPPPLSSHQHHYFTWLATVVSNDLNYCCEYYCTRWNAHPAELNEVCLSSLTFAEEEFGLSDADFPLCRSDLHLNSSWVGKKIQKRKYTLVFRFIKRRDGDTGQSTKRRGSKSDCFACSEERPCSTKKPP